VDTFFLDAARRLPERAFLIDRDAGPGAEALVGGDHGRAAAIGQDEVEAGQDTVGRVVAEAAGADVVVKASGVGVFDDDLLAGLAAAADPL
jgi:hypothetical protein